MYVAPSRRLPHPSRQTKGIWAATCSGGGVPGITSSGSPRLDSGALASTTHPDSPAARPRHSVPCFPLMTAPKRILLLTVGALCVSCGGRTDGDQCTTIAENPQLAQALKAFSDRTDSLTREAYNACRTLLAASRNAAATNAPPESVTELSEFCYAAQLAFSKAVAKTTVSPPEPCAVPYCASALPPGPDVATCQLEAASQLQCPAPVVSVVSDDPALSKSAAAGMQRMFAVQAAASAMLKTVDSQLVNRVFARAGCGITKEELHGDLGPACTNYSASSDAPLRPPPEPALGRPVEEQGSARKGPQLKTARTLRSLFERAARHVQPCAKGVRPCLSFVPRTGGWAVARSPRSGCSWRAVGVASRDDNAGSGGSNTGGFNTGGLPADGSVNTGGLPADGSVNTGGTPADSGSGGAPADAASEAGNANKYPCKDSKPVLVNGQPTGLETCGSSMVARKEAKTCPKAAPGSCSASQMNCTSDSDCTAQPNGYCEFVSGGFGVPTSCSCAYGCVNDSECPAGQRCLCGDPVGTCVPADCSTSADCTAGFDCVAST